MRRVAAHLPLTILKMTTHAMSGSSPANHNIRNNKACDEWLLTCKLQYQGTHVQRGQWLHAYKSKFSYKKMSFQ